MPFDPDQVREFERAGWNRAARNYETSFATATRQFIAPLLDAARVRAGGDVLDLCCGPGFVAAEASGRGARVRGLDFSSAMLAAARQRFPAIAFDHGDAEIPPYEDGQFDSVVSNFGIHHVPRPAMALAEARRVLRPGGTFAFSIWAGHEENIAWKLVFDAVRRFGDPDASAAPPPGGGFATTDAVRAMTDAGFASVMSVLVRGIWRHPDAWAMLAAMRAGTARMAAMLEAQSPVAMAAIEDGLGAACAAWRDDTGIAVPIACVIIAGIRP